MQQFMRHHEVLETPVLFDEARFSPWSGFFAGADDRPSQSPGGPGVRLPPTRVEEARQVEGRGYPQRSAVLPIPLPSPPIQKNLQDFPKSRAKSAFNLLRH
jgi:hypothetical protein